MQQETYWVNFQVGWAGSSGATMVSGPFQIPPITQRVDLVVYSSGQRQTCALSPP